MDESVKAQKGSNNYVQELQEFYRHLDQEKALLDKCCNKLCLGVKRLKDRDMSMERIHQINKMNKWKQEEKSVDIQEVDELIEKAQKLLQSDKKHTKTLRSMQNDSKKDLKSTRGIVSENSKPESSIYHNRQSKCKSAKQQHVKKSSSRLNPASVQLSCSRLISATERKAVSKVDERTYYLSREITTNGTKKTFGERKVEVPVPFTVEFKSLYQEVCRLTRHLNCSLDKHLLEKEKSIQDFFSTLYCNLQDESSESFDDIDKFDAEAKNIAEMFEYSKSSHNKVTDIYVKEDLLFHLQLELSMEKLRGLTMHSDVLKRYLMDSSKSPEETLKLYRLAHWILCGTLPVLIKEADNVY